MLLHPLQCVWVCSKMCLKIFYVFQFLAKSHGSAAVKSWPLSFFIFVFKETKHLFLNIVGVKKWLTYTFHETTALHTVKLMTAEKTWYCLYQLNAAEGWTPQPCAPLWSNLTTVITVLRLINSLSLLGWHIYRIKGRNSIVHTLAIPVLILTGIT